VTFADRIAAALMRPPLSEVAADQRAELIELARDATDVDDLPGKWQAAVLEAESEAASPASASPGGCRSCHHHGAATAP
jgi:hypothetical protein